VLKRIEQVDVHGPDSSPVVPITIVDCGELDRKDHASVTTKNGDAWNCLGTFSAIFKPF
jgi:peptidyl-prolyl isomerase G (cyclophilin G)